MCYHTLIILSETVSIIELNITIEQLYWIMLATLSKCFGIEQLNNSEARHKTFYLSSFTL